MVASSESKEHFPDFPRPGPAWLSVINSQRPPEPGPSSRKASRCLEMMASSPSRPRIRRRLLTSSARAKQGNAPENPRRPAQLPLVEATPPRPAPSALEPRSRDGDTPTRHSGCRAGLTCPRFVTAAGHVRDTCVTHALVARSPARGGSSLTSLRAATTDLTWVASPGAARAATARLLQRAAGAVRAGPQRGLRGAHLVGGHPGPAR